MDTQFVAMLTACAQRDQAGLEAAIAQGADINRAAEDGSTALLAACSCGFSSGVEYLFNHPDSTDDAHNQRMADGRNTLFLAVQSGDHDTVEIVLRKAAVPRQVYSCVIQYDLPALINSSDQDGDCALHYADARCIELLFAHGARICCSNRKGRTPLFTNARDGRLDCAREVSVVLYIVLYIALLHRELLHIVILYCILHCFILYSVRGGAELRWALSFYSRAVRASTCVVHVCCVSELGRGVWGEADGRERGR